MSRRLFAIVVAVAFAFAATTLAAQTGKFFKPGAGITLPRVVKEVKPSYTRAAMQQKIQGSVWLLVVVTEKGDVGEVEVSRSLDKEYGLDEEAIKATREWKFESGKKDGKPVAVQVTIELTFTLK